MVATLSELKQVAVTNSLRGCRMFAGLSPADLNNIANVAAVKSIEKGEYLFHEGDSSCGFYVVQNGAINVHRVGANGKEQVIHVFRPGESLGEASLATERGYPADARAVVPSQVILVRRAGFLALLKQRPELALQMLSSMSFHLRVLVSQIEDMTLKDVETRLATWLLKRCPDPEKGEPVCIHLQMTKRALAAEVGTVSATLSRTLAKFRQQKLIAVEGKNVTVLCPSNLRALLRVD